MAIIPAAFDVPRCVQTVAKMEAELERLTSGLTECQFHAPPRGGGWSIGQCIEHLILTGNAFLPVWDAAIETAVSSGNRCDRPFPYSWMERGILRLAEPPYRMKVKTKPQFIPYTRRTLDDTVRRFLKMHHELTSRLSATQGLDARRVRIRSPFVAWIQYPLGLSFDLALTHERRHLWQAWQVRAQVAASTNCAGMKAGVE